MNSQKATTAEKEDAKRWQLARQYLSIDDIERITSMRAAGHIPDEEQSKRADSAIDAVITAMQAQGAKE